MVKSAHLVILGTVMIFLILTHILTYSGYIWWSKTQRYDSPCDQNDDSQWISGDSEYKQGEGWTKRNESTAEKHCHGHSG